MNPFIDIGAATQRCNLRWLRSWAATLNWDTIEPRPGQPRSVLFKICDELLVCPYRFISFGYSIVDEILIEKEKKMIRPGLPPKTESISLFTRFKPFFFYWKSRHLIRPGRLSFKGWHSETGGREVENQERVSKAETGDQVSKVETGNLVVEIGEQKPRLGAGFQRFKGKFNHFH